MFRLQRSGFGQLAAAAPVRAIRKVIESIRSGFRFTDPTAFSPEIFVGMASDKAAALAQDFAGRNVNYTVLDAVDALHAAHDPMAAILANLLKRPGDPMVATRTADHKVLSVLARSQVPGPILNPPDFEDRLKAAEDKAAGLEKQLNDVIAKLQPAPTTQPPPAATTPPAPPLK
jgi:hypothetical protein